MMAGRDLSAELFDAQPEEPKQSWLDEVRGGIASAPIDLYLGAKQIVGDLTPEEKLVLKYNKAAAAKAPVSALVGGLATYAPLSMVPGANTILGGIATGVVTGALQPVEEGGDRLMNAGIGGLLGGLVPVAMSGGGGLKRLVIDPRTQRGQSKIVGRTLGRQAGNIEGAIAKAMQSRAGNTPGFEPTLGQASGDQGLATLERTLRASSPEKYAGRDVAQRTALARAMNSMAGDDATLNRLMAERGTVADDLYARALDTAPNQPKPETAAAISELVKRPSINTASKKAQRLAMERGELPAAEGSLRAMQDVKTTLDDLIAEAKIKGKGGEVKALMGTKEKLLAVLDDLSPEYRTANQTYAKMSEPINQMQVARELRNRMIPSLYRDMEAPQQLNAASFTRALTDMGDDIASSATGMKGAKLEKVMTPEQLKTLQGIAKDMQMMKVLENSGRGAGSDTMQKLSKTAALSEAGIPQWLGGAMKIGDQGLLGRVANAIMNSNDDAIRAKMIEATLDPEAALHALNIARQQKGLLGTYAPPVLQGGMFGMIPSVTGQ